MIGQIAKSSEDFVGLRMFRIGIERDAKDGRLSRRKADDLHLSLERMRGYAALQIVLYAAAAIKRLLIPLLPPLAELAVTNAITSGWSYADRRVSAQLLHLPGFLILRCIPGIASCIGNIAMLRADPRLYDVALRVCERAFSFPILRLLIPIYVRPSMRVLRWLMSLDWPTPSPS